MPIQFYFTDVIISLPERKRLKPFIKSIFYKKKRKLHSLIIIFCSDEYLLNINKQYLNHDTYTDTVTFDNSEIDGKILGDIFISIDRVRENAKTFKTILPDELHRVMIHSTLHLLGYKDKSAKDKGLMTAKEDNYLGLRGF